MTRTQVVGLAIGLLVLASRPASAAGALQRYTLVIGANAGGDDRSALQYAISDAERFARVMVDLGGVEPENQIVLKQPSLQDLAGAFTRLTARVTEARRAALATGGGRTEVLVYYSGHADEQGLLFAGDRYSYRTLRDRLDAIPADVRIAVLDACASGAFTRLKGGRKRRPFLVDESAVMRGHAFLTSSAATEAAQESDRIRASYFTHYLLSGLRGAADLSGDGRVTLHEAYQFAFNETLRRTVDSKGGPQHPSYDIKLSGTGDVVMTDVRQTSATLVLDEDLDGRFFVRTSEQELVVELYKPAGRRVALGLEPGAYVVRLERPRGSLAARVQVDEGARVVLDATRFGPAALETTTRRGGEAAPSHEAAAVPPAPDIVAPRYALPGRHRIEGRLGVAPRSSLVSTVGLSASSGGDALAGVQYTYFLNEWVALTTGANLVAIGSASVVETLRVESEDSAVFTTPVGVHLNVLPPPSSRRTPRPFIALAATPAFGVSDSSNVGPQRVQSTSRWESAVGGQASGGVDFFVGRDWSIAFEAGYVWLPGFNQAIDLRKDYSGAQVAISVGWLFGRGVRTP